MVKIIRSLENKGQMAFQVFEVLQVEESLVSQALLLSPILEFR